jgi:predicted lipid-binding transport protein (Tim44 family)
LEEETFLHEGLFSGASSPFGLQKPKKTKYVEEITQPIALIAANAEQSQKTQAAPPSSNSLQNPLLMGMLIGVLAGGVLFMLGCWLLLGFARF